MSCANAYTPFFTLHNDVSVYTCDIKPPIFSFVNSWLCYKSQLRTSQIITNWTNKRRLAVWDSFGLLCFCVAFLFAVYMTLPCSFLFFWNQRALKWCSRSLAKAVFWSSLQEPSCLHSQGGKQVHVLCVHRVWSRCWNNCRCSSEHSCMMASDLVNILPSIISCASILVCF